MGIWMLQGLGPGRLLSGDWVVDGRTVAFRTEAGWGLAGLPGSLLRMPGTPVWSKMANLKGFRLVP